VREFAPDEVLQDARDAAKLLTSFTWPESHIRTRHRWLVLSNEMAVPLLPLRASFLRPCNTT